MVPCRLLGDFLEILCSLLRNPPASAAATAGEVEQKSRVSGLLWKPSAQSRAPQGACAGCCTKLFWFPAVGCGDSLQTPSLAQMSPGPVPTVPLEPAPASREAA